MSALRIYVMVEDIWYPQNAVRMFRDTGKFTFVDSPKDADIIWAFSYYQPAGMLFANKWAYEAFILFEKLKIPFTPPLTLRKEFENKLIVASFHHLYQPKEITYIHRVRLWDAHAQVIQFFSHKNIVENADYFSKPMLFAPYWLNLEIFRPYTAAEKQEARRTYGLPLDKKIIGSFQRDTDRDGSPKLEKGPDVFCDALEPLAKENIFVLLAGPRRSYVENRLTRAGIPFKNVGDVGFDEMNALYQCLDCYLVTSRCEGGPQAILECMAAKVPVLSTDVGIAGLLNKSVICATAQDFTNALRKSYPDVIEEHYATAQMFEADKVAEDYKKKFEDLYRAFVNKDHGEIKNMCDLSRREHVNA